MASRKKESEGIALLSMYYDEEEDEEMEEAEPEPRDEETGLGDPNAEVERIVASDSETVSLMSPPLQQHQEVAASDLGRRRQLTIVEYGRDEVAMSPEPEEGKIESGDRVMFDVAHQSANDDFHEKTPPGTAHILTPATQATLTPQSPEHEPSEPEAINYAANVSETGEAADPSNVSGEEPKEVVLLDNFLPSPPKDKCSVELQERINKFLLYKRAGKSFNAEVRNRKDYRNPDFLLHAVRYQDIDQIGSCFSKGVFDPHGYDKSDYVEEIEADMKREMERKEQERKKNPKGEFISVGNQPAPPKITMPLPAVPSGATRSMPTALDSVARDGRQNKKSKWDKVDGDRRNPLPSGGQDSMSSVGTQAALLSAANAGSGYTAFARDDEKPKRKDPVKGNSKEEREVPQNMYCPNNTPSKL